MRTSRGARTVSSVTRAPVDVSRPLIRTTGNGFSASGTSVAGATTTGAADAAGRRRGGDGRLRRRQSLRATPWASPSAKRSASASASERRTPRSSASTAPSPAGGVGHFHRTRRNAADVGRHHRVARRRSRRRSRRTRPSPSRSAARPTPPSAWDRRSTPRRGHQLHADLRRPDDRRILGDDRHRVRTRHGGSSQKPHPARTAEARHPKRARVEQTSMTARILRLRVHRGNTWT